MSDSTLLVHLNNTLMLVLMTASPVLLAAVIIGITVGLIQALTQIQDQTLPQAVKLIATLVIVLMLGPVFGQKIANQMSTILNEFPVLTR